jgi:hypothetical protein
VLIARKVDDDFETLMVELDTILGTPLDAPRETLPSK